MSRRPLRLTCSGRVEPVRVRSSGRHMERSSRRVAQRRFIAALAIVAAGLRLAAAHAQDANADEDSSTPTRPAILFNRWQEDWSVLADPSVPREPLDELKYISLSSTDPKMYLSLGADFRDRFESNDAPGFGTSGSQAENYVISRNEIHADLRLGADIQIFTQLQSDWAPWKKVLTPVDADRLGVEQGFIAITRSIAKGTLKVRIGRQQIAFDIQRFVSVRDGPNVRQSYDAVWVDYERGPWRVTGFYSQPVQNRDASVFDDYSSHHLTFGGAKLERQLPANSKLSVYYAHFTQDSVTFPSVSGNESRDILDAHYAGAVGNVDWDLEGMRQTGTLGPDEVRAWALGSLGGYTLAHVLWTPRLGLQVDAASGNGNPNNHVLGTFNPLFPNGYYVTLSGYTGYVNFVHVKPSLTLHPASGVQLMFAIAGQWRQTTSDAVYTQPDIPVAGTVGASGRYTGTYGQFRLDWTISRAAAFAIEATRFDVSDVITRVGGHDSDYVGVEIKFGW